MSIPNVYNTPCNTCHEPCPVDEGKPAVVGLCKFDHVCPKCFDLIEGWKRDEAFMTHDGEMVWKPGFGPDSNTSP